jgi:hypothetical protein
LLLNIYSSVKQRSSKFLSPEWDLITIKHSIPVQATPVVGNPKTSKSPTQQDTAQSDKSSLLCKGRIHYRQKEKGNI